MGLKAAYVTADGTEFRLEQNGTHDRPKLVVYSPEGVEQGTPIALKETTNGKTAADFPGVNPDLFATDGEHGGAGSITDG